MRPTYETGSNTQSVRIALPSCSQRYTLVPDTVLRSRKSTTRRNQIDRYVYIACPKQTDSFEKREHICEYDRQNQTARQNRNPVCTYNACIYSSSDTIRYHVSAASQAVFGGLGATTVALKLHKVSILGGAVISPGAAAVIAEDLITFVALFGAWYLSCRALFSLLPGRGGGNGGGGGGGGAGGVGGTGSRALVAPVGMMAWHRVDRLRLAKAVHWLALLGLSVGILLFVGVEHLYFYSTR